SMSESTGPSCGELAQSYFFKHNIAALSLFVGEWLIEATPDPLFRGESQLNILAYRMLRKHGRSLKLSTDPLPGGLVFGSAGQVFHFLQKEYASFVGDGFASHDIHQVRLSCAVGSDDATKLSCIQHHRQIRQGFEAIKA